MNTSRLTAALADRYRIERELGQGGMATVYLADDVKHGRQVALKVLKPELAAVIGAERFVVEIKTTAALQHPHILPLFDSGEADGFLYYVMPFIDGETLRAKLDRETQLGVDEAVKLTVAVADALDYAHRQSVIHRDIKPENILLADGRPMVADFGIALALSAAAGGRMTETGLSLGTPHYMSPEQATAEKEITARSDQYSLASVLYEMLTGNPPHTGASAQQIIMKIITEAPADVTALRKSVPAHVAAATAKALEKLPADRFASTRAFAEALGNPAFTLPGRAGEGATASSARRGRLVPVLALITIATTALAAWGWLRPTAAGAPSGVSRYSIRLPDSMQLDGGFAQIALAPDGSRMFFTATDGNESGLWYRDRDRLDATRIPGTAGAVAPFVSPTGDQIGYMTPAAEVYIVPSNGGVARAIDGLRAGAGASWGPDGMIYLGRSSTAAALTRAQVSGGAPADRFTTLDTATGERAHIFPDALPNGRGVLFTIARSYRGEEFKEIGVVRTADGSHTALVRGVYARYAASGHLLYVTADGALMAAPFDQDRLVLTGPGVALVTGLTLRFNDVPDLAISRSGTLLYSTGGPSALTFGRAVWVGRDGVERVVDSTWQQSVEQVALSPDATRLAVTVARVGTANDLWVRDLTSGTSSRLTSEGSSDRPTWTPDGRELLFVGERRETGGVTRAGIFRQEIGTRNAVPVVLDSLSSTWESEISRDGQWLVRSAFIRTGGFKLNIRAQRLTGDTASFVVAEQALRPSLSPDGRWLAFTSGETGRSEVYVQSFPESGGKKWPVSTGGGDHPLWARNGRELFYRNDRAEMVAVAVSSDATPPLGRQQVLFSASAYVKGYGLRTYDVTPDGQRFVMIQRPAGEREDDFRLVVVERFTDELAAKVPR